MCNSMTKATKQVGTGRVLELSVLPALNHGGYKVTEQIIIGQRITGMAHKIDILASKCKLSYLVSLKWQQVSGTAEQKVPFEVICLKDAVELSGGTYERAYLVLGGPAWTMREFFISDEFDRFVPHRDSVTILTFEDFMALANSGRL